MWRPLSGGHLHCKFGSGITQLWMHDFVVPVNKLTCVCMCFCTYTCLSVCLFGNICMSIFGYMHTWFV